MEILMKGPGEATVTLVDRAGRTLAQQTLVVSGSPRVQAKVKVPLVLGTTDGEVAISPVLLRRSDKGQDVTFDGKQPSDFTRHRCEEIGCSPNVVADAVKGLSKPLESAKTSGGNGLQLHPERSE